MKFGHAVTASIFFHSALLIVAYFSPQSVNSSQTTYYVDLVQIGGNTGSSSSVKKGDIRSPILKKGSLKDLTVKKEIKPKLSYPDKKKKSYRKKDEEELISVVKRKKVDNKQTEIQSKIDSTESAGFVRTGVGGSNSGGPGGNFPYSYYVETLKGKITSSWYNPLSSSGISGRFLSVVYFRIYRDGSIKKLKLIRKSGNKYFDLSTLRVVKEVLPFPPLPSDYPDMYLGVYFEFEWER